MRGLLLLVLQCFGISVVLTPILRDVFRSFNLVDQPDHNRKVHVYPIPRIGGIAIIMAYFSSFLLMNSGHSGDAVASDLSLVWNLLPAAVLVFAVGLVDDFIGLKPTHKLRGQLGAALLAYWAGVRIDQFAGYTTTGVWGPPVTILWLLVCTNAFNLVDGLDGLAAGVGLLSTLAICAAGFLQDNAALTYATLPLAGCLLGFLCFNFNPATVFLGDGGSLFIGFMLGCFGVIWTQKSVTLIGMTAPLMALSIPLIDVLLCIVRRWLRNQPIFGADRGHIHHRLLDRGLTPRRAVLLVYAFCGLAALFSLLQAVMNNVYLSVLLMVIFCIAAWIGVHYLGYAEFMFAGRLLRPGEFQRTLSGHLHLSSLEKAIAGAHSAEECWKAVLQAEQLFGFAGCRLAFADSIFEKWPRNIHSGAFWTIHVPISESDFLEVAIELGSQVPPGVVVPFVNTFATALMAKTAEFRAAETAGSIALEAGN